MTTATKITLARVIMIPVFMLLMLFRQSIWALAVFIVASLTDLVDGYIARNFDQTSDFGKFLDPLADKLLVLSAILIFLQWGRLPAWAVMLVLTREFAVSGLRMVAAAKGSVIAAGFSGKLKTASTMIGLCVMIAVHIPILDIVVLWAIVSTTLLSGVEYFLRNGSVIS